MAVIVILLWIGSAISGWFGFWPWLAAPMLFATLHILRVRASMRAARKRIGMPEGFKVPGTSMVGADVQLLFGTLFQHLAIFGIAAGLHWLIG